METGRDEKVIQKFKQRRKISYWMNFGFGFLLGLCWFYVQKHLDVILGVASPNAAYIMGLWAGAGIALSFLGAGMLMAWLFSVVILRCPSCQKYVGFVNLNFCPLCGISLG